MRPLPLERSPSRSTQRAVASVPPFSRWGYRGEPCVYRTLPVPYMRNSGRAEGETNPSLVWTASARGSNPNTTPVSGPHSVIRM